MIAFTPLDTGNVGQQNRYIEDRMINLERDFFLGHIWGRSIVPPPSTVPPPTEKLDISADYLGFIPAVPLTIGIIPGLQATFNNRHSSLFQVLGAQLSQLTPNNHIEEISDFLRGLFLTLKSINSQPEISYRLTIGRIP